MTKPKKAAAPKKEKAAKPAKEPKTETATTVAAEKAAPVASAFTLEDNVPIPARIRAGGVSPYPFIDMQPGQSFVVEASVDADLYTSASEAEKAKAEESRTIANRLSGAVRRFTKRHTGYKFAVRTVPEGVRVWRVEA